MIKYLEHEFELRKYQDYTHLDKFKCAKCNIEVVLHKNTTFDPEKHSFMVDISFIILEMNCTDIIVKNILE